MAEHSPLLTPGLHTGSSLRRNEVCYILLSTSRWSISMLHVILRYLGLRCAEALGNGIRSQDLPSTLPLCCPAFLTVVADKLRLKYPWHRLYMLYHLPKYSLELIAIGVGFWSGCWLSPTNRYTKNEIFKLLFSLDTGIFSLTRIPLPSQLWSTMVHEHLIQIQGLI